MLEVDHSVFGNVLKSLLAKYEMTTVGLAWRLSRDRTTVYKWLRGGSTPSRTDLDALIEAINPSAEDRQRLEDAWDSTQRRRGRSRASASQRKFALSLLDAVQEGIQRPGPDLRQRIDRESQETMRGPIPSAMISRRRFRDSAIQFVSERLASSPRQRELLVVYHDRSPFHDQPEEPLWLATLHDALDLGWTVKHLVRIETDPNQPFRFAQTILGLLGLPGDYSPRYLPGRNPDFPNDLIIEPELGALLLVKTHVAPDDDIALYLRDNDQVYLLADQARTLWGRARPVVRYYLNHDQVKFEERLLRATRDGTTNSVKPGLTTLTQPPNWWTDDPDATTRNWAFYITEAGLDLQAMRQARTWRLRHFREHPQHPIRCVCPRSAIDRLLQHGLYAHDDAAQKAGYHLSELESLNYLDHLIEFLSNPEHGHFEFALLNDIEDLESSTFIKKYAWLVGKDALFMETQRKMSNGEDIDVALIISEPTMVRAFQATFEELWRKIPSEARSVANVTGWLRDRAQRFRANTHLPREQR